MGISRNTVRHVQRSPSEKKAEAVTNSALFQRVLELMLNLCTLGGSQRAVCPGIRHNAYTTSSCHINPFSACTKCALKVHNRNRGDGRARLISYRHPSMSKGYVRNHRVPLSRVPWTAQPPLVFWRLPTRHTGWNSQMMPFSVPPWRPRQRHAWPSAAASAVPPAHDAPTPVAGRCAATPPHDLQM